MINFLWLKILGNVNSVSLLLDAWQALSQAAHNTKLQAIASSTKRNILTQVKAYLFFCNFFLVVPFPVSPDCLCNFAQFLSQNFKSPGAVKNYIFGLQSFSHLIKYPFPDLSNPEFKNLFKGMARIMTHVPTRAQPLSPPILLQVLKHMNLDRPYEAVMWAIMVLGFQLFLRISNLLPSKYGSFDTSTQLTRKDVSVASDAIVVDIKWSKTNQNKDRIHSIPLKSIPGSPFCPLFCVLRLVRLVKVKPTDHLFSYMSGSQVSTIIQSEFVSFLREKLRLCGYKEDIFSGHSLRRGGASWAFSSGVCSELIKSHGDWKSQSYLLYLQFSMQDKLQVSENMFKS